MKQHGSERADTILLFLSGPEKLPSIVEQVTEFCLGIACLQEPCNLITFKVFKSVEIGIKKHYLEFNLCSFQRRAVDNGGGCGGCDEEK